MFRPGGGHQFSVHFLNVSLSYVCAPLLATSSCGSSCACICIAYDAVRPAEGTRAMQVHVLCSLSRPHAGAQAVACVVEQVQLAKQNMPITLVLISAYGLVGKECMHASFAQRARGGREHALLAQHLGCAGENERVGVVLLAEPHLLRHVCHGLRGQHAADQASTLRSSRAVYRRLVVLHSR